MSTELATINQEEYAALVAASGASAEDLSGGGGDYLPQLKVNYTDTDDNGKDVRPGYFMVTGQDPLVYAKNVTIRPLTHNFQWTQWDDVNKKTTNRTRFVKNFKEEPRDENGSIRCGKPVSKILKESPELAKAYSDITLYRSIDVLVSYTGEDADGNTHVVKDLLATMRLKGSNFSPFDTEYIAAMPKGTMLWDYNIVLSTSKHKQDPKSIVNYYVIHFDADFANRLPLTVDVFQTIKGLNARIEEFNTVIDKKYYGVINGKAKTEAAIDAIDITPQSPLEDDFNIDAKVTPSRRPGKRLLSDDSDIPF